MFVAAASVPRSVLWTGLALLLAAPSGCKKPTEPAATASSQPAQPPPKCLARPTLAVLASGSVLQEGWKAEIAGTVRKSDKDTETVAIAEPQLWLTDARGCLHVTAALADMTIPGQRSGENAPAPLGARPLGSDPLTFDVAALETAPLAEGALLVVHWRHDDGVQSARRFALPVVIKRGKVVAGETVQTGQDTAAPPAYYGWFEFGQTPPAELVLHRKGKGSFPRRQVLAQGEDGAFHVVDSSPPSEEAAEIQDGNTPQDPIRGCGAKDHVEAELLPKLCRPGERPRFRHLGLTEKMPTGRRLERYALTCEGPAGRRELFAYVDMSRCSR